MSNQFVGITMRVAIQGWVEGQIEKEQET